MNLNIKKHIRKTAITAGALTAAAGLALTATGNAFATGGIGNGYIVTGADGHIAGLGEWWYGNDNGNGSGTDFGTIFNWAAPNNANNHSCSSLYGTTLGSGTVQGVAANNGHDWSDLLDTTNDHFVFINAYDSNGIPTGDSQLEQVNPANGHVDWGSGWVHGSQMGNYLMLQQDGNLVIYYGTSNGPLTNDPLWASNTVDNC